MQDRDFKLKPEGLNILGEIIRVISRLLYDSRIYPPGHGYLDELYSEVYINIKKMLQDRSGIVFRCIDDSIYYHNFRMKIGDEAGIGGNLLRKVLDKLNIREIELNEDLRKDELKPFINICLSALKKDRSINLTENWSRIHNIIIRTGEEQKAGRWGTGGILRQSQRTNGRNEVGSAISKVLDHLEKIESSETQKAGKMIIDLILNGDQFYYATLLLKSLKSYDLYTFNHSINVAVISSAMGSRMGYSEERKNRLGIAALLHDIGKLYVPREIIHKQTRLTPQEWRKVKKHPVEGYEILNENNCEPLIRRIALEHHMGYDRTGYPRVGGNYTVMEESHIIRIADTYDALTTTRPYREQLSPYEAVRLMQEGRGSEFEPSIFDIFMTVLGNIPIGSIVKLNTGEIAVVVDINEYEEDYPVVRLLKDEEGCRVNLEVLVDLREKNSETGEPLRYIDSVMDSPVREIDIGSYLSGREYSIIK